MAPRIFPVNDDSRNINPQLLSSLGYGLFLSVLTLLHFPTVPATVLSGFLSLKESPDMTGNDRT